MLVDARQFAVDVCRAVDVDPWEKVVVHDLQDNVVAMTSLSNYYDALRLIPKDLPFETQKEYRCAVAERCVLLVRESLAECADIDRR